MPIYWTRHPIWARLVCFVYGSKYFRLYSYYKCTYPLQIVELGDNSTYSIQGNGPPHSTFTSQDNQVRRYPTVLEVLEGELIFLKIARPHHRNIYMPKAPTRDPLSRYPRQHHLGNQPVRCQPAATQRYRFQVRKVKRGLSHTK